MKELKVNPVTASYIPPAVQLVLRQGDGYNACYLTLSIADTNALIAELSRKVVEAQGGFPANRELKQGELPL